MFVTPVAWRKFVFSVYIFIGLGLSGDACRHIDSDVGDDIHETTLLVIFLISYFFGI